MIRLLSINLGNLGSTGKIMYGISEIATKNDYITFCAYPKRDTNATLNKNDYIICNNLFRKIYEKLDGYIGVQNSFSIIPTLFLIKKINKIQPSIIQLHNLHGGYINLLIFFNYLYRKNISVVWTLHDCWAFTGRCPHFVLQRCEKWKTSCKKCTYPKEMYPIAYFDHTKLMWEKKKKLFTKLKNLTIVTPSFWLADLVKESFLKNYNIKVINNGIDLEIFKPRESNFREKYKIENKFLILGVSNAWGYSKGLDVFIKLSKELDEQYQIVLVGTNNYIDKMLPKNIITIHRTDNQKELAKIYSIADIFVNPTREDTFPTVNIEALACGIPVITFNTGGSPEIIDSKSGFVINSNKIDDLKEKIIELKENNLFKKDDCINRARLFNQKDRFKEYIDLYNEILK